MTKRGELVWNHWTVMGTKTLIVRYNLESEDGIQGIGEIEIEGEGEPVKFTEDEYDEIISACLEDSLKKKDWVEPRLTPQESYKLIDKFDFGKN